MEETTEASAALSSGYKLVPWSSWDQWDFVRVSLFSSDPTSVAAALRRVSAWRSRGCLPVAIDVTAAIIEIQQKDPVFREGISGDDLNSGKMLVMLYCMAIMRLVNGFVEPIHKKTGRSISELADAIGIPRMLVDIRHESSHRDLPSLQLVRLASMKALDWLKSNYWEPQRNAVPDVPKEIRSKLREMIYYLNIKHAHKSSSYIKGRRHKRLALLKGCNKLSLHVAKMGSSRFDGGEKKFSRILKIISRLYSAYPSEVVSAFLEFFQLHTHNFLDDIVMEHSDYSNSSDSGSFVGPIDELKTIIIRLSKKRPGLLLSMVKAVLEMIQVKDLMNHENGQYHFLSSHDEAETCQIKHLCSLLPWLLINLKALKDSGQISVLDELQAMPINKNAAPRVLLKKFLNECLALSILGDKHLTDSVFLLAEMIENASLTARLKKLPILCLRELDSTTGSIVTDTESMLSLEEDSIKKAADKLKTFKLRLRNQNVIKSSDPSGEDTDTKKKRWTLSRSWIPCPIGMLPCSFSSTVHPDFERFKDGVESKMAKIKSDEVKSDHDSNKREESSDIEFLEIGSPVKKLRQTQEDQSLDPPQVRSPMKGLLLIDGFWKKVSQEELFAIESDVRIFA